MNKRLWFVMLPVLLLPGITLAQQFPMLDMVADKLVQKYQQSSCEQLWQEKAQRQGRPKPEMEQNAVDAAQRSADAYRVHQ
jgi:hypothetical protein